MKQRYERITLLRGIASISIVLHHFTIYLLPQINRIASTYTPFFPKSYLWVDFFFILSGFTISLGYNNKFDKGIHPQGYKSYLLSRLSRIYPLHILTMLFMVMIEAIYTFLYLNHNAIFVNLSNLHPPFTGKHNILSLVTNALLIHGFQSWSYWNEPAWFLGALWIAYLFMPLMILVCSRISTRTHIALVFIAFLPLLVMARRYGTLDFVTYRSVVRALCEVYIGIFVYRIVDNEKVKHLFSKSYAFPLLIILIFSSIALHMDHVITILFFPAMILSAVHTSDQANPRLSILSRTFYYLGTISFSVYMVHWPIIYLFQQISLWTTGEVFYTHFQSGLIQLIVLLSAIGIVILISHFSYCFLEQKFMRRPHVLKRSQ